MLCMFILYMSGGTCSLKSTPNDRFFGSHYMAILFPLRVFDKNLLRESHRRNIFFIFRFCWSCLTWALNRGLTANMRTQYLLGYGYMYVCIYTLQKSISIKYMFCNGICYINSTNIKLTNIKKIYMFCFFFYICMFDRETRSIILTEGLEWPMYVW